MWITFVRRSQRREDTFARTDLDLSTLLARIDTDSGPLPKILVGCGTEDRLIIANRQFVRVVQAAGIEVRSKLGPGEHSWALWDATIQDVVAWLPPAGATNLWRGGRW
jgi:S-formylglutathione hydrolase FrmB